eukprot:gb/GECH01001311.1/.p1 GENE.gb/GECH01001311.1/~~gb/GECH01001311.1/.p1  ORF type:complete len:263 (+),score=56.40 gb/GECH01001311.1/:1-789(+)
MGFLLNIYIAIDFFIFLTICCLLQLIVLAFTFPFDRKRFYVGRIFRSLGFYIPYVSGIWDFGIEGKVPEKLPERAVVVSNHDSNLDCLLISNLPWEMKWLSKSSLKKIPLLGWCMQLAGDIFIKRGDSSSTRTALHECEEWIDSGSPVFIFPEGTRRRTSEMGKFHNGAFRLAIESKSHIVPLAVSGTWRALEPRTARPQPATARVMVGEAIDTSDMTLEDLETLKTRTRASIESMLKQLKPITTQDDGSPGSMQKSKKKQE